MPSPSPDPVVRVAALARAGELAVRVLPERRGWPAAAVATWAGCLAGWGSRSLLPAAALAVAAALLSLRSGRAVLLAALVAAGSLSGAAAALRLDAMLAAPLAAGTVTVAAVAAGDPVAAAPGTSHQLVTVRAAEEGRVPAGTVLRVALGGEAAPVAGDSLMLRGRLADRPGRLGADRYRATLDAAEVVASGPRNLLFAAGNTLRRLVLDRLGRQRERPEGALLAGLLVGDTTGLSRGDLDDLRAAGLSHYVAVSGSNVALFLGAWFLLVGPLALPLRARAVTGLVALAVFVVATRWEPSVVRAAVMAGVVLGGSAAGIPVDVWRALGITVTGLLLVSGDLAVEAGFQLSVLATVGVLMGMRLAPARRPRWLWSLAGASLGAQVAVVPVLLVWFGTVPLLSPVANVAAAPLVTAATALGGVGVLGGVAPLAEAGLVAARGVLGVARIAGGWPQLGTAAVAALVVAVLAWRARPLRPALAAVGGFALVVALLPLPQPGHSGLVFLDVGQGDAVVITDAGGGVALVDGGRHPADLEAALRRQGIGSLDLVVITHGDTDHVGGLAGLVRRRPVAALWYPRHQPSGEALAAVVAEAAAAGTAPRAVGRGDSATLGSVRIEVVAPGRRFQADNDGSLVLWVTAGSGSALLTGDIEAVAQAELPPLRPDVLQVPHHGSATTDPRWLAATVGATAVISVGPNPYGHPAEEVLAVLEAAGASVHTTWEEGDIAVALCGACPAAPCPSCGGGPAPPPPPGR